MKPKGINLFEQHVEKIVIGVAGIIVLGIAAKAFFTEPNAVTLDGKSLGPAAVDEVLADKARRLKANLESSASLEVADVGQLTQWFEKQHDTPRQPEAPGMALVAPVTYKIGSEAAGLAGSSTEMYAEVAAPAPKTLQVTSLNYTIDPQAVTSLPDLAARFPGGPPYDLNAVHIAGEFDGKALRSALSGFVESRKVIPSQWVDQDMAILDVIAQREQMLPNGTWSSPEVVSIIPGQDSVRAQYEKAVPREKNEILQQLATYGATVYEPPFYAAADGTSWTYDIVKRAAPKSPEVLAAERTMNAAWKDVQRAQDQLDRYLKQLAEKNKQSPGGVGEAGGPKGKGAGIEGGPAPTENKDPSKIRETPDEIRQRKNKEAITKATEVYDAAKAAVLALDPEYNEFPDMASPTKSTANTKQGGKGEEYIPPTVTTEGDTMPPMGFEGGGKQLARPTNNTKGSQPNAAVKGLFDNPSIRVWAHDITATPGVTYRYRLAVGLYNPFFGRESRLAESQQGLAKSAVVLSQWTDWSDAVRVSPPQQFFAVTGIYSDQIDERSASFEVYSFTRGEHRVMTVTVRPGEPIGERRTIPAADPAAEPLEVDFFTGATLLDVVQVEGGSALDQRLHILVAMPDGSIEVVDPTDPTLESERQRLRGLLVRS